MGKSPYVSEPFRYVSNLDQLRGIEVDGVIAIDGWESGYNKFLWPGITKCIKSDGILILLTENFQLVSLDKV